MISLSPQLKLWDTSMHQSSLASCKQASKQTNKKSGTYGMALQVKVYSAESWKLTFHSQNPRKGRESRLPKLSSASVSAHTSSHAHTIQNHSLSTIFLFPKLLIIWICKSVSVPLSCHGLAVFHVLLTTEHTRWTGEIAQLVEGRSSMCES